MKSKLPAITAKDINDAHRLARSTAESAVQHAIRCGKMLAQKKTELDRGEFDGWVEKNCDFARAMAYRYIKAAAQSSTAVDDSSRAAAAAATFPSIRSLLGYSDDKQKTQPDTKPRSAKGAVMNPPESAAKGYEAGNRNKPAGGTAGQVRPPAPASHDPDVPEWTEADEAEAAAVAEADERERTAKAIDADDKLAEALEQIKRQSREIGVLKVSRDGYMNTQAAAVRAVKDRERQIAALEKKLKKAEDDNEALRERIAKMEGV
jgi:hypothetical protein